MRKIKKKFLVSAYGCEPNKGSEPGIGWQWSLQLVKFGEVHIITRKNNKEVISKTLSTMPKEISSKLFFYYYDTNKFIKSIKKGDNNLYPYYFCWQIGAYRLAKRISRDISFDYCFALTFGSIWMPTFMYKLNIPFVWGPIGGGEAIPDEYFQLIGKKSALIQRIRKVMMKTVSINPLIIRPLKKSKIVIARTDDTVKVIPQKYRNKVKTCLETSIDLREIQPKEYKINNINEGKISFIYTGRLINIKGIELIILAIPNLINKDKVKLILVGDGPQKKYLQDLSEKLNILNNVYFTGKISRPNLLNLLRQSDVFIFPSLKEGGSWALMEGMGASLPVICLDSSGMHIITDETCAIRIPVQGIDDTIKAYTEAMDKLIKNKDMRIKMGNNSRRRIEQEFNWNKKGDFLLKEILNKG